MAQGRQPNEETRKAGRKKLCFLPAFLLSSFIAWSLLLSARQFRQSLLCFLNAFLIGVVRGHVLVQFLGTAALVELLIVNAGGAQACFVGHARIPLEGTLEIDG